MLKKLNARNQFSKFLAWVYGTIVNPLVSFFISIPRRKVAECMSPNRSDWRVGFS